MIHTVYLSLGSNRDPLKHLQRAVDLLRRDFDLVAVSHAWRTAPVDADPQTPDFVNMAVALRCALEPADLYLHLKALEVEAGRVPRPRHEPHEIDIDLLACDACVIDEGRLHLPHRSIPRHAYVLRPLCDIAPSWRHPTLQTSARDLLDRLSPREREGLLDLGPLVA